MNYLVHCITTSDSYPYADKGIVYTRIKSRKHDFRATIRLLKPDVIVNAAGSPSVGFSAANPDEDYYLNFELTKQILKGYRTLTTETRFIQLSSAAVYGNPSELPIDETSESAPISNYGNTKLKSELELERLFAQGFPVFNLRLFSVYGPGLKKQLFWDIFEKYLLNSKRVTLFGTGKESRDFIYIDDVICTIINCFDCPTADFLHYNVCAGKEITIRQAAACFLDEISADCEIIFNNEVKKGDPINWLGLNKRLGNLGVQNFTEFEDGIKEYAKWILKENKLE